MDFQINGYQLIENCDEAIYVAKTKEDVYQFLLELNVNVRWRDGY